MLSSENMLFSAITSDLARRYGSGFKILGTVPLSGGSIHRSCKLSTSAGNFFLKWSHSAAPDIFVREAESLQTLSAVKPNSLIIPSVVAATAIGQQPGYLLLEYLEAGRVGDDDALLGRGVAELHLHQGSSRFGFFHNNYCGATEQDNRWSENWPEFYAQNRIGSLILRLSGANEMMSSHLGLFNRFISKIPQLLPEGQRPSLIHGDLWSGNFLYTTSGPALVDPAAYFADREMELGIMTLFGGFSNDFWAGYQEIFPLEPGWRSRAEIYQVYHLLNHHLLFGGSYLTSALHIVQRYM